MILALTGCGDDEFPLAPVAGTVKMDGAPLADAQVGFEPLRQGDSLRAGPGSYGKTDPQGRYRLKTLHGQDGAVIGPHVVWISTPEDKEYPHGRAEMPVEERIPQRYRGGRTLRFSVPADGTDRADFELSSK